MADQSPRKLQLFVRLLDGKSSVLNFASRLAYGHQIKQRIFEQTKIPTHLQRLICGGYQISDGVAISMPDVTVNLVLSLRGGKGGFGSLLRGAATKAGAKKTNNFDACRDMSGRRLRHVNAEKKLEEWKAGEEERKLEKLAQEFLKKQAIKGKQGVGNGATQKYVKKYREESAKRIEAVELALKESFQNGKRKGKKMDADSEKSKRLKIWMGKRAVGDSDSDDSSDEEDEKSALTVNGSRQIYTVKEINGSSDPTMAKPLDSSVIDSSKSCYEEKKDINVHQTSDVQITNAQLDNKEEQIDHRPVNGSEAILDQTENKENPIELVSINNETVDSDTTTDTENTSSGSKSDEPINFDNFSTASDMEVLGMERLKNELQMKGMKCGGALKERAERLFLLKSTPLEKIPKKLMAAKIKC